MVHIYSSLSCAYVQFSKSCSRRRRRVKQAVFRRSLLPSQHSAQSWKNGRESIELWDCSGDKKYESCWGAILKGCAGIIMVYDVTSAESLDHVGDWLGASQNAFFSFHSTVRPVPLEIREIGRAHV